MDNSINTHSLGRLSRLFSTLSAPSDKVRSGVWRGRFIGPWWLRGTAPTLVGLTGLPGWQGKRFLDPDRAANIVVKRGATTEGPMMNWVRCVSKLDGKDGVGLRYVADAPMPWRWVTDELRAIDADTILGMTVLDVPGFRRIGFPFLLTRK